MSADLLARFLASFSLRFSLLLFPPSSNSPSMAVGSIFGGLYAPPAPPSSASSSTLLTSASGFGRNASGSSSSAARSSLGRSAIFTSLSIWYRSLRSTGLSFSR